MRHRFRIKAAFALAGLMGLMLAAPVVGQTNTQTKPPAPKGQTPAPAASATPGLKITPGLKQVAPPAGGASVAGAQRVSGLAAVSKSTALKSAFPLYKGLGSPVTLSMRSPALADTFLSASGVSRFYAGELKNPAIATGPEGRLHLEREMGASITLHLRPRPGTAYAVEFNGDAGEWSLEYVVSEFTANGASIAYTTPATPQLLGLNQWLIVVPAKSRPAVDRIDVTIRAPFDGNDMPREKLTMTRISVAPIQE